MRLAEYIVLVTGAGRGMGCAIALCLAPEGAHIVTADIDATSAQETAAAVEALGWQSLPVQVALGQMDILGNNAG